MYNEIISLLPSKTLKAKIAETGHEFTENELIYIIYEFAKTFEQRKNMLLRFARCASPEAAENALMLVRRRDEMYRDFCENGEGCIYELRIREEEYCEERFICASYEAALKYIDLYYAEYGHIGVEETERSRYHIVKRKIYGGKEDEGFSQDGVAECILGAGKKVLSVDDRHSFCQTADDDETACPDCELFCPAKIDYMAFPCFVQDCDVIRYTSTVYGNGEIEERFCERHEEVRYGIVRAWGSEPIDYIYTLPFDSAAISEHKYDEDALFHAHDHIYAPLTEVVPVDELDEKMQEDYAAYMAHLNGE